MLLVGKLWEWVYREELRELDYCGEDVTVDRLALGRLTVMAYEILRGFLARDDTCTIFDTLRIR